MTYTCPVCGYDELTQPPRDYMICPCCFTEFGYDDFTFSPAELRGRWITNGANWHSRRTTPPANWNAAEQLLNILNNLTTENLIYVAMNVPEKSGTMTISQGTLFSASFVMSAIKINVTRQQWQRTNYEWEVVA